MQEVSAILFDVDGTLVDTYRLYIEAYRRALEPYLGYVPSDEEVIARPPRAERRFLEEWVGPERIAECHARMLSHYRELHGALCEGVYEGVREMLGGLRSAGIRLGVVTGKGRDAWNVTASELDLGAFDVVVTEEDAPHPKPDPAGLLSAQQHLWVPLANLLYIGDSLGDMEAGRAAGIQVGAALWPKTDPEDRAAFLAGIERAGVDYVFERPADIIRRFAAWC